jgi:hypothetical protein
MEVVALPPTERCVAVGVRGIVITSITHTVNDYHLLNSFMLRLQLNSFMLRLQLSRYNIYVKVLVINYSNIFFRLL